MGIGPFKDYEGLIDPLARAEKLRELDVWFRVAHILETDLIQIPCTFNTEGVTGDPDVAARDLRQLADLGAAQNPPFRFAYENLCFGSYNDTWEKAWELVKKVDRDNFGLCLDTFNIAGREWADPAASTGMVENGNELFRESLRKMVQTIDVQKVFYVQVVDAERLSSPLDESHPFHLDGQKPRMSWSRNCRLFMFEEDRAGYMPVLDVLKAICDEKTGLGYKGWISAELFNRTLTEEGEHVPREHAERCMRSWKRIVATMGWGDITAINNDKAGSSHPMVSDEAEIMARL